MAAVHLTHSADGGAGRAARRAVLACREAGLSAAFAFVAGERREPDDIHLQPARPATATDAALREALADRLQWGAIPQRRTTVSNTLLSVAWPGVDPEPNPAVATADLIHLHWPTWAVTPPRLGRWLDAAHHQAVFWTLHDLWPMTGGCHYPAGCEQWRTACLKCPQLEDDAQIVANAFAEKRASWGLAPRNARLNIVSPSRWLADLARQSALLGGAARIAVVPNPVETDIFAPRPEREGLRAAFGIGPDDLALLFGSADNAERRKGGAVLAEALRMLAEDGRLSAALPPGGRVVLLVFGASPLAVRTAGLPGVRTLHVGKVEEDAVLADLLAVADLACVASLEENYPNVLLEAHACGTPGLGFDVGGIGEMIEDGRTGVLVPEVGDAAALAEGLVRFARRHRGDPAMRAACRARVEAENAPAVIGAQLRALYEEALADRGGAPRPERAPAMHARVLRAAAAGTVAQDPRPGPEFLRYPLNRLLTERAAPVQAALLATVEVPPAPAPAAPGTARVVAVRTHHAHHSARSGPYQFLRHLPSARFLAEGMAVPLGAAQAGKWAEPLRAAGRLLGASPFGQQGNAWIAEGDLLARCAAERVDLVHFIDGELGGWMLPSLPAALFHGGRRPAFVATFHQPPALLGGMVNREALGALDAVVVLCESMRRMLAHWVAPDRLEVIPHGVDAGFFTPGPATATNGDGRVFRMLAVGHWLRDYDAGLRAVAMLRERAGPGIRLTIVCHNFPHRGPLPEGVELRAGLSDEELRQAYRDADCLFLPLRDATANNAVLEAMACGRPVISTEVGGVPEMTGHEAALLCPPGDAAALAEAVHALAFDPALRAAMGRAARARAEALDWPVIGARHAALYDRLLAATAATPEEAAA